MVTVLPLYLLLANNELDHSVVSVLEECNAFTVSVVEGCQTAAPDVCHVARWCLDISPLKMNDRPLYLKTQSVPRCKHFSSRL